MTKLVSQFKVHLLPVNNIKLDSEVIGHAGPERRLKSRRGLCVMEMAFDIGLTSHRIDGTPTSCRFALIYCIQLGLCLLSHQIIFLREICRMGIVNREGNSLWQAKAKCMNGQTSPQGQHRNLFLQAWNCLTKKPNVFLFVTPLPVKSVYFPYLPTYAGNSVCLVKIIGGPVSLSLLCFVTTADWWLMGHMLLAEPAVRFWVVFNLRGCPSTWCRYGHVHTSVSTRIDSSCQIVANDSVGHQDAPDTAQAAQGLMRYFPSSVNSFARLFEKPSETPGVQMIWIITIPEYYITQSLEEHQITFLVAWSWMLERFQRVMLFWYRGTQLLYWQTYCMLGHKPMFPT